MDLQHLTDTLPTTPALVLDADTLRENLAVLQGLRERSGCKVLYSIKALPLSSVLAIARPYVDGFAVSSLFEAKLAAEFLPAQASLHLSTPGIRPDEWPELAALLTHVSFNSAPQYLRLAPNTPASCALGLRVNPHLSFLDDARFNPCRAHSKLGISLDELWQSSYLEQVQGLHVHTVFAATDFKPLIATVAKLRSYFGKDLAKLKWLNLGGGYLFKQIADHRPFIELVLQLRHDFGLEVFIEPGKAVVGDAGHLLATVLDCFVSDGKTVAILDTSVNHNPEVFEYQRQPSVYGHDPKAKYPVLLAGCTCLAGDVFGEYRFHQPLAIGTKIVFTQVGAYSLIKAHRFNGYNLPDIYVHQDARLQRVKHYAYADYRQQWSAQA